jgi:hypothetical protein
MAAMDCALQTAFLGPSFGRPGYSFQPSPFAMPGLKNYQYSKSAKLRIF